MNVMQSKLRKFWLAGMIAIILNSACAPMATKTLYKSNTISSVENFNHLVIAAPTIIDFDESKVRLIRRTHFPLLSGHLARFGVECIPFEGNAESDIANRFEDFHEKVPYYSRYLLAGQITRKKPERQHSDVFVEYRIYDLKSKELLIYTKFDSTLGIVSFEISNMRNAVNSIPVGGYESFVVFIQTEPYYHDDIKFIGEALVKGLKEIEIQLGVNSKSNY